MKIICALVVYLISFATPSHAATLQFSASVQNEELAEESIALLHCLVERSGDSWEFTGDASGPHWLRVKEEGAQVRVRYFHENREMESTLKAGQAEEQCAKLLPSLTPPPALSAFSNTPNLEIIPESKSHNYWPWAVAAGAAVAAGFFIWRSSGPDHRALQMN
ncbi:MAG: hypothetical protein ACXWQO_18595 [Bdellovibrionota bacterium]